MPIGFIKGNSYHLNWDYDRFAALPIFKRITQFAMKQNVGLHIQYSHITRAFDCEVRKIEYFKHSAQPYFLTVANRGGNDPLEAVVNALRIALPPSPLLSVLCLEAECTLLGLAIDKARDFEAKLDKTLDELWRLCTAIETMECNALVAEVEEWDRTKEIIPKKDVARVIAPLMSTGIPADDGEDDDL